MSTLQERIEELMRDTHLKTPTQIAEAAKVTPSAVSQWLGNGGKPIHAIGKIDAAINLERATGYNWLWLAKGAGPKRAPERGVDWPFSLLTPDLLAALTPRHLFMVQRFALDLLEDQAEAAEAAQMHTRSPELLLKKSEEAAMDLVATLLAKQHLLPPYHPAQETDAERDASKKKGPKDAL